MVNYREILRLHSLGQSQRTIRSSAHCSDNTVRTVLEVASQKGIQWPLDDDITNADLERILYCMTMQQPSMKTLIRALMY